MSAASEKLTQLGLDERLPIVSNQLNKLEKRLSKDEKPRLKRFLTVFGVFQDKLKGATTNNTRFLVFERTSAFCDSILASVTKLNDVTTQPADRRRLFEQLDELADQFLEYLPEIKVTESHISIIEEAKEVLKAINIHRDEIRKIRLETETALEDTRNYKAQNESISQQLATKVLAGDFHERAEKERTKARYWTAMTSAFAVLAVVAISIFTYWQFNLVTTDEKLDLQLLSSKILIASALGLAAKWASKRANRHLIEESKYHRLAVNSATMKEFIATLPDNEKHVVISAVALKIFTEGTGNESSTEFEPSTVADLIKSAQGAINKPS